MDRMLKIVTRLYFKSVALVGLRGFGTKAFGPRLDLNQRLLSNG